MQEYRWEWLIDVNLQGYYGKKGAFQSRGPSKKNQNCQIQHKRYYHCQPNKIWDVICILLVSLHRIRSLWTSYYDKASIEGGLDDLQEEDQRQVVYQQQVVDQ